MRSLRSGGKSQTNTFIRSWKFFLNQLNFLVTMEVLSAYVNIDALEDQGHC